MRSALPSLVRRAAAAALALLLGACGGGADAPFDSIEVAARGLHAAAFSPDGRLAAAGSLTQGGSLWDLASRERRFNWNHATGTASALTALAFSPEGSRAISADGETLVLWDAGQGAALRFFTAPSRVRSLALGPGGRLALLGLDDGSAVVFDAERGGILRSVRHEGAVNAVAMDAAGGLALSGGADGTARLWEVATGTERQRWTHAGEVRTVDLAPDGSRAFTASKYDRSAVWDCATGLELAELPTYASRIVRGETFTAARFAADGSLLLTGTTDGRVLLWEAADATRLAAWKLPRRSDWKRAGTYVVAVGFEGDTFVAASADGFIHRLQRQAR